MRWDTMRRIERSEVKLWSEMKKQTSESTWTHIIWRGDVSSFPLNWTWLHDLIDRFHTCERLHIFDFPFNNNSITDDADGIYWISCRQWLHCNWNRSTNTGRDHVAPHSISIENQNWLAKDATFISSYRAHRPIEWRKKERKEKDERENIIWNNTVYNQRETVSIEFGSGYAPIVRWVSEFTSSTVALIGKSAHIESFSTLSFNEVRVCTHTMCAVCTVDPFHTDIDKNDIQFIPSIAINPSSFAIMSCNNISVYAVCCIRIVCILFAILHTAIFRMPRNPV